MKGRLNKKLAVEKLVRLYWPYYKVWLDRSHPWIPSTELAHIRNQGWRVGDHQLEDAKLIVDNQLKANKRALQDEYSESQDGDHLVDEDGLNVAGDGDDVRHPTLVEPEPDAIACS